MSLRHFRVFHSLQSFRLFSSSILTDSECLKVGHRQILAFTDLESKRKNDEESPILLHHNVMGSRNNFTRFAKEINHLSRRRVLSFDARNHGDSFHAPEMSYSHLISDVKELLAHHNISKTIFLGSGMGGRVGMSLSTLFPSLIEKLIVVNSSPLMNSAILKRWTSIQRACECVKKHEKEILSESGLSRRKAFADKLLSEILFDQFDRSLFLTNLTESNDSDKLWKLNLSAISSHETENYSQLDSVYEGPVLFVLGEKAENILKSDENEIIRLFPNASFVWIPNCGYWIHAEKYSELLEAIIPFLKREIK